MPARFTRETIVPAPLLEETLSQLVSAGAVVVAVRFGDNMSTIVVERRARRGRPVPPAVERRRG